MSNDTPISESDAIFARAYADAIKNKFQVDVGKQYILLTSPVTQRGIAAGDLIYPQMTNYLIYRFADDLQFSDNPSYTGGSAGSYIQQLNRYVSWFNSSFVGPSLASPFSPVMLTGSKPLSIEDFQFSSPRFGG
jgi:hypothetical protein